MPAVHIAVVDRFISKPKNVSAVPLPSSGYRIPLLEARDPRLTIEKKYEIRMRPMRLCRRHFSIVDCSREPIPNRPANHAHQAQQRSVRRQLGHRIKSGYGDKQPTVRCDRHMMDIVEARQRNDFPYCERRKVTNQNFGLGAKIGAISFDRGRFEYNRWRFIRTMFRRTFVFQHTFNPACFGFDDQRLFIKLPFSRKCGTPRCSPPTTQIDPEPFAFLFTDPDQRCVCKVSECRPRNSLNSRPVSTSSIWASSRLNFDKIFRRGAVLAQFVEDISSLENERQAMPSFEPCNKPRGMRAQISPQRRVGAEIMLDQGL